MVSRFRPKDWNSATVGGVLHYIAKTVTSLPNGTRVYTGHMLDKKTYDKYLKEYNDEIKKTESTVKNNKVKDRFNPKDWVVAVVDKKTVRKHKSTGTILSLYDYDKLFNQYYKNNADSRKKYIEERKKKAKWSTANDFIKANIVLIKSHWGWDSELGVYYHADEREVHNFDHFMTENEFKKASQANTKTESKTTAKAYKKKKKGKVSGPQKGNGKGKDTGKTNVRNTIIKEAKISQVIVDIFNREFADKNYYLVMSPLDIDYILKDFVLEPLTFKQIVDLFQKKYGIYRHGYNIFIDGNIFYLLNKKLPNRIDYFNDWTYIFTIISEQEIPSDGVLPIFMNFKNKTIELAIERENIKFSGEFTDDVISDTRLFNMDGKEVSDDVKESKTGILKEISLDNIPSGVVKEAIEDKDSLKTIFSIAQINIFNTFLTFMPGDNIEIKDYKFPELVWKGTVKRWVSQQNGLLRGVYLVSVGYYDDNTSGLGNFGLKGKLNKLFNKSNFDKLKNVVNDAKSLANTVKNGVKDNVNNLRTLPGNLARAQVNIIGEIGLSALNDGIKQAAGYLDNKYNIDSKGIFNLAVNSGIALYNHPITKKIIDNVRPIETGTTLGLTIGEMIDSGTNDAKIGSINAGITTDSGKITMGIVNKDEDSMKLTDKELEKINYLKTVYLYLADSYDKALSSIMSRDINQLKDNLFWDMLGDLKEYDRIVLREILLDFRSADGYIRRPTQYPYINKYIDYIRDKYKEGGNIKEVSYTFYEPFVYNEEKDTMTINGKEIPNNKYKEDKERINNLVYEILIKNKIIKKVNIINSI